MWWREAGKPERKQQVRAGSACREQQRWCGGVSVVDLERNMEQIPPSVDVILAFVLPSPFLCALLVIVNCEAPFLFFSFS